VILAQNDTVFSDFRAIYHQFAPEHVMDLQKSGLSVATVKELEICPVVGQEVASHLGFHDPRMTSILCFPYPLHPGFCRDKVFPTNLKGRDGHGIRYLQRSNSGSHLYIPPLAQKALSNPTVPLYVTEGEKKAAKACQENLPCIGLGGLWNWVKDGKPIPDLSLITWQERQVILVPDSDVWCNRPDLLHAVYALGAELKRRGAYVRVLKIA
jgi:hypothetical protein